MPIKKRKRITLHKTIVRRFYTEIKDGKPVDVITHQYIAELQVSDDGRIYLPDLQEWWDSNKIDPETRGGCEYEVLIPTIDRKGTNP